MQEKFRLADEQAKVAGSLLCESIDRSVRRASLQGVACLPWSMLTTRRIVEMKRYVEGVLRQKTSALPLQVHDCRVGTLTILAVQKLCRSPAIIRP